MPFKSAAQARFMFAKHPKIAKKWAEKYGGYKDKPEHVKDKEHTRKKAMKMLRRAK